MESPISPSTSKPEGSFRTLWYKICQIECQAPTARTVPTRTNQRLPAQEEKIKFTHIEQLLFYNFWGLILFSIIRLDAFIRIYDASHTLESAGLSLYNLHNLIWTMNLFYDTLFALFELVIIICLEHFYGTIFFTLLRFVHFAISLKQAILPEIPENALVRKELSHIYSLDYLSSHLFFNFLLCYLLSRLLFVKITNRLKSKGSNSNSRNHLPMKFRWPIRNLLNYLLMVIFSIFFIICWYIFGVLEGAKKALKSMCISEEQIQERLRVDQAWDISLVFDMGLSFFELAMIPISGLFHCTIFFTVIRFAHLAVNLKQLIHPELPEDAWLREQYSGLYSPFYVCLHLFFNVLLCCFLPVYIFQLYSRPKIQTSEATPAGIPLV